MGRLDGRVALITGAARGMGAEHVRGLTKSATLELGPMSIRVNSVHPAGIATEG